MFSASGCWPRERRGGIARATTPSGCTRSAEEPLKIPKLRKGSYYRAWLAAGGVPLPAPPPCATGRQINGQASAAGITMTLNALLTSPTAKKPDDVRYFNSVGLNTPVPVDNPKVGRVLTLAGVKDVPAFMAAALLLPGSSRLYSRQIARCDSHTRHICGLFFSENKYGLISIAFCV